MFIVKSRKEIIWTLLFAFLGVGLGVGIHYNPYLKTFRSGMGEELVVIVDAGHGLPDGGAVGVGGTVEQEINLSIALKLCEVLEGKRIKVVMTRVTDNCLCSDQEGKSLRQIKVEDMKKRLDIIKKSGATVFVSIHMNYYPDAKVDGLRLFYDKNHAETKILAENIQSKMSEVTGAKMYAVKTADPNLFLMKNPPVPAVLVECGFLSNAEEEKKLNDEEYKSRIAWAIADAIEKYYKDI